jgi:hypothetical protein
VYWSIRLFLVVKGPAADATDALQPWGFLCNPMMKMKMIIIFFCPFPSNGAPVEWNWQGKTEELGEKPVPVPLCPQQIPHGLTRDRTRASAVGGRRLTASATARPSIHLTSWGDSNYEHLRTQRWGWSLDLGYVKAKVGWRKLQHEDSHTRKVHPRTSHEVLEGQ